MQPLVATGVRKRLGHVQALDGLELSVGPGEAVALLGPNGAGKSSTMAVLSGKLAPDEGRVLVLGEDPRRPAVRRWIGFVPQSLAIYPELTVSENLSFFGGIYGLQRNAIRERSRMTLESIDLWSVRDRKAETLSGGMKRRLNFACSVLHSPRVLLLDEPTAGVDASSRAALWRALRELKGQGTTIVMSTHHAEEAEAVCDRVVELRQGRVLTSETQLRCASFFGDSVVEGAPRLIEGTP